MKIGKIKKCHIDKSKIKIITNQMKTRFIFEIAIAIIGICAVLLFGDKGGVVLVLIALLPVIFKKKFDDEDKIIFRKVSLYTIIPLLAFLIALFFVINQKVNGYFIRDISWWLAGFFLLLSHGFIGLIFFGKKK